MTDKQAEVQRLMQEAKRAEIELRQQQNSYYSVAQAEHKNDPEIKAVLDRIALLDSTMVNIKKMAEKVNADIQTERTRLLEMLTPFVKEEYRLQ